jgi:hypothetical protein
LYCLSFYHFLLAIMLLVHLSFSFGHCVASPFFLFAWSLCCLSFCHFLLSLCCFSFCHFRLAIVLFVLLSFSFGH